MSNFLLKSIFCIYPTWLDSGFIFKEGFFQVKNGFLTVSYWELSRSPTLLLASHILCPWADNSVVSSICCGYRLQVWLIFSEKPLWRWIYNLCWFRRVHKIYFYFQIHRGGDCFCPGILTSFMWGKLQYITPWWYNILILIQ